MLFSSAKTGHLGQILSTGVFGEILVNQFAPPTPDQIQAWGSMVIQVLVGIVTIWATIRKALQKPESVLKMPAGSVAAVAAPAAATVTLQSTSAPTMPDGDAQ